MIIGVMIVTAAVSWLIPPEFQYLSFWLFIALGLAVLAAVWPRYPKNFGL